MDPTTCELLLGAVANGASANEVSDLYGASFKWSSGLEADLCFKSKTFKLYRKMVKRDLQLRSKIPLSIKGVYSMAMESRKASKAMLMEKVPPLTETPYDVLGIKHLKYRFYLTR